MKTPHPMTSFTNMLPIKTVGITLSLAASLLALTSCNTPTTTQQPEQTKSQVVSISPTQLQLTEQDSKFNITVKYPKTPNETVNKSLETYVNNNIQVFKGNNGEFPSEIKEAYIYDVNYKTIQFNDDIVTYVFKTSSNTGAQKSSSSIMTQTYDLKTGKTYHMQDLVPNMNNMKQLASQSVQKLEEQFQELGGLDTDLKTKITNGTNPTDYSNYQAFAITPENLIIYFQPDTVAPLELGYQEIHLNREKNKSFFVEPFNK